MRYSTGVIGKNAGKVWATLQTNPNISLSALERQTQLKKEDILLSLGWLFKEEKIDTRKNGKSLIFSLK